MRATPVLGAILIVLGLVASDGRAAATSQRELPDQFIGAPRVGGQTTRAQLVREAKRQRAMAASRAYWARPEDSLCYKRPFFTVYGWRMAKVCGGGTAVRFD